MIGELKVKQATKMYSFTVSEIMNKYVKMSTVYGEQIYYTGIEPMGLLCLHIAYVIYYISFSLYMICNTAVELHIAASIEILQNGIAR